MRVHGGWLMIFEAIHQIWVATMKKLVTEIRDLGGLMMIGACFMGCFRRACDPELALNMQLVTLNWH